LPTKVFIPDTINPYKNVTNFINLIKGLLKEKITIIVSIESKKFLELLIKFFNEYELTYKYIDSYFDAEKAKVNIYKRVITGGFINRKASLAVFNEKIFLVLLKFSRKEKSKASLQTTLLDLEIGSYVVHVDYGIARFKGLVHKTIGNIEADFLVLEYENNEILYVPISSINQIQKYVGSSAATPRLSSLKSSSWSRIKKRAYSSARKVAG